MPKAKIVAPQDGARLQALDLRTLGRPIHLLPLFERALQRELGDFLERELNRRYHAAFRISSLRQNLPAGDGLRWQWHALGDWQLGSHFDRSLLLGILDYRFGAGSAAADTSREAPAETETERRLARNLAERLLPRVAAAIRQLGGAAPASDGKALPLPFAGQAAWQLEIDLCDGDAPRGTLRLSLGAPAFEALLQNLSGQRPRLGGGHGHGALGERLTIRLDARLLQQELPLGTILDLKPGTVLPVTLPPRAEVCVEGSPLFSAQVVERQGKLCLSGFADTE